MLLFGLTTAFLFVMVQICGVGQRRWLFWPLKELCVGGSPSLWPGKGWRSDKNRTSKGKHREQHT